MEKNKSDITFVPETFNMTSYLLEENIVQGRGNNIAIYYNDKQYTYYDITNLCNKIGNILKEFNVEIEDRVLLILQDSPKWVASFFAITKIGGVATWGYTYLQPNGYADIVNLVRPRVIIVDDTTLDRVREGVKHTRYTPIILVNSKRISKLNLREYYLHEQIKLVKDSLETEPTSKDDIAFWYFSGGTTGKPKAVPHMHRDVVLCTEILQRIAGYTEHDIVLNVPKLFFHYARIIGMDIPFRAGASLILFPDKTTAETIFNLVDKYKPTVLINVPTMMRAMIQVPHLQRKSLNSLRFCFSSGELLSQELHNNWMKNFGIPVVDILGSAESGAPYLGNQLGEKVPGSTGKALPFVKVKIVDKKGIEVANGKVGKLLVQTDAAGQCYVRQHDESKSTFLGDDWIDTGDLFRKDEDGNFWFEGRSDEMVKVSGVWISLLEIGECIEKHHAVKECVVLGIEDQDGVIKSKAFISLKDGYFESQNMEDELKQYCKNKLAPYKSPKFIEFCELPKTGAGKIDKRLLRSRGL